MITLTLIEMAAAYLDLAARHEHNEPYFKQLVAEAHAWAKLARKAEIHAQRSTNDGYSTTLDAVREEMGLDTASRPIVRKSESEVSS